MLREWDTGRWLEDVLGRMGGEVEVRFDLCVGGGSGLVLGGLEGMLYREELMFSFPLCSCGLRTWKGVGSRSLVFFKVIVLRLELE